MAEFELRNTIKVERAKRDMTQAELALIVGVSRKTINTIETGKFIPSTITAFRIAKAFELKVEEVFELIAKDF
ncbi:MAG: helix-turn-helix transcriptional regulator [Cytophagales bacterium]|nr:helix-turn-helix transcriptional regulator [Cytophagales bacterium]